MKYIKVIWRHLSEVDPYAIYSEIDDNDEETRKIEFLKNGKLLGFACENFVWGGMLFWRIKKCQHLMKLMKMTHLME